MPSLVEGERLLSQDATGAPPMSMQVCCVRTRHFLKIKQQAQRKVPSRVMPTPAGT